MCVDFDIQCYGLQQVKQNTHISYGKYNTVKTRALNRVEVNENLLQPTTHQYALHMGCAPVPHIKQ